MNKLSCGPFEHFATLKWREKVETEMVGYLESDSCGMRLVERLGRTDWDRAVCLFATTK